MKKALSIFLALVMLMSSMSNILVFAANTAEEASITVEKVYSYSGGTVDVTVDLKNNPGICNLLMSFEYDSTAMKLIAVSNGTAMEDATFMGPKNMASGCSASWYYIDEPNEYNDGSLAILTFEILDTVVADQKYPVSISNVTAEDADEKEISISVENGTITIIDYVPGDVNGDNKHTIRKDVSELNQYIVDGCKYDPEGYGIQLNEAAADVNDDDKITIRDVININKYIVDGCQTDPEGYNITLLPHTPRCQHTSLTEIDEKEPTCTEAGNYTYWDCDGCDNVYADADGLIQISLNDVTIEARHTEETIPAVKPTCTEVGFTEGTQCSVCEEIIVEPTEVPATGHTYATAWSSDNTYHWHTATCEHHDEVSDKNKHTLDAAHVCTVCSYDASGSYKLATPENVKVSYDRVTWDAVDNADYYTVRVNGDYEIVQRGTSAPLSAAVNLSGEKLFENESGINKHGLVSVTVRANENGNYSASDFTNGVTYYYIPDAGESSNRTLADNYRLGNGYNLVEQTFSTGVTAKRAVFNLGKLFAIDTFTSNTEGNGGYLNSYYFTSADDYVANNTEDGSISAKVGGGFGPVSASLKTDLSYSSSENYKSHKYNATYISRFDQVSGTTAFGMQNSNIRIYALSDQFVQDIRRETSDLRNMSDEQLCEYLFKHYGTHAVLGVQRGANFVTSYVISTDSSEDSKSATSMFKLGASANVSTFFNASLDISSQGSNTITLTSESTTSTLKSSYYGGSVDSGIADGKASIEDWDGSVNPVTIGLTEAIAISSLIKQVEEAYGVTLGRNENGDFLGDKFEAYVNARATSIYNELYSRYTYDPPFDVEVKDIKNENDELENVLVINLSKYQGTGSLENANCTYLTDGVFTVYPNMLGKRIDKIKVVSSFNNNDIGEKNLIDGFSIQLSNKWKRDVEVEFENIGVRALENGLVDKTKTSGITVTTSFKGLNLVEQNGTSEMYIVTDTASYKVALGLEEGEKLFAATIYMDKDTIVLPVAEKRGYSFSGWKTPDGQIITKKDGTLYSSVDLSKLTLLHAEWTLEQFEITLDNDYAATPGTATIIEHYGYMFADVDGNKLNKIMIPEKPGYTFEGYYKKVEDNGFSYAAGIDRIISSDGSIVADFDTFDAHTTVYAMYKPMTYPVNLYVDSEFYGRFFEVYGEMICDENEEPIRQIAKLPEKAGYTFNGFSCSLGQIVDKDGYIIPAVYENYKTFAEDTDIEAVWIAEGYAVTFDPNGTNVTLDPVHVTYGEVYGTLPAVTRDGYTFNGWKLDKTMVNANTVVKSTSNHTLVADWTAHTYTFEFYGNGATSGSTANSKHTYDVAKKLTANGFLKSGYSFGGWNTKADGTGISFADEEEILNYTVNDGEVIKLYAQWPQGDSITVKFNANGGSASFGEKNVVYDSKYGTLPTVTRTGFTFGGWYTALTGGTKITESSVVNVTSTQTLYARWIANSFTAKWNTVTGVTITVNRTSSPNAGAATGKLSSGATVYYGDVLSVTYAVNDAYKLTGNGATSITVTGNVTSAQIYANTSVKSYTAKWSSYTGVNIAVSRTSSPNGKASTGALSSGAIIYYGDVLSISYSAKTGYTLGNKGYTSITVTDHVNSSHIYASATANSYTVTYNLNAANSDASPYCYTTPSCSSTSKNGIVYGASYTLAVPKASYYTFDGWWTAASGGTRLTDKSGNSVSNWAISKNTTVYAHWTKTKPTYTYVKTVSDLNKIRNNASGNYFLIGNISNVGTWTTIPTFSGVFDGNGNTISGLKITIPAQSYSSNVYYGFVGNNTNTIKNVTFTNATVSMDTKHEGNGWVFVGVVCGINSAEVSNVKVKSATVSVHRTKSEIGIISGTCNGTISGSTVESSKVYGNGDMGGITGGLCGKVSGCTVKTSTIHLYAVESDDPRCSGGAVGFSNKATIENTSVVTTHFILASNSVNAYDGAGENRPSQGFVVGAVDGGKIYLIGGGAADGCTTEMKNYDLNGGFLGMGVYDNNYFNNNLGDSEWDWAGKISGDPEVR